MELSDNYGYVMPYFVNICDFFKESSSAKLLGAIITEESVKQLLPLNVNGWILVHTVSF